ESRRHLQLDPPASLSRAGLHSSTRPLEPLAHAGQSVSATHVSEAGVIRRRLGESVLDRQRGVVVAVVEENGCGGAGGIAGDVGERLLGAAVESEACLGGEGAGAAV